MRPTVLRGLLMLVWSSFSLAEETNPSLELLEYLGSMVEQGDELIGPLDLDDEPEPFPDSIVIEQPGLAEEEEVSRD
ncbi:MAG: hypothetical protein HOC70_14860 [Gammaproteobacteria bacterium]|jgi:hypothetical protein|nr:hypothetical protein [Gammaproteobacteria bacterium]MBT4494521.1 hypothetical protein [Gammaproteobacteria bacterium]MBT7371731.1 hypothetical protein [Gammaproteobacteria bacterium]